MVLTLPISPSVNAMYRRSPHGFGMYKTKEAKDWIKVCRSMISTKRCFSTPVEVHLAFYFSRERDLDNGIKAILDLLQEANVIENDSQVYSILAFKYFDKANPRVEVRVDKLE